jgi:hypothetical protein
MHIAVRIVMIAGKKQLSQILESGSIQILPKYHQEFLEKSFSAALR